MSQLSAFLLMAVATFASLSGVSVATTTANYCSTTVCSAGNNIACNNNGAWGSKCPSGATLVDITDSLKNELVRAHNEKRNFIAGGGASQLSPACRMATIRWSDELAYLASLNVKQCEMRHDACHNTDTYKYSGQDLAWMGWYDPLNATHMLDWGVQMWYDEVSNTKQEYIDAYPSNYNGPVIGHFTVMVADRNVEVGCSASIYSVSGESYKAFLLACNYATTNVVGVRMYQSCSKPATGCKTGTNPLYPNLCSTSESYNVNSFN